MVFSGVEESADDESVYIFRNDRRRVKPRNRGVQAPSNPVITKMKKL